MFGVFLSEMFKEDGNRLLEGIRMGFGMGEGIV